MLAKLHLFLLQVESSYQFILGQCFLQSDIWLMFFATTECESYWSNPLYTTIIRN